MAFLLQWSQQWLLLTVGRGIHLYLEYNDCGQLQHWKKKIRLHALSTMIVGNCSTEKKIQLCALSTTIIGKCSTEKKKVTCLENNDRWQFQHWKINKFSYVPSDKGAHPSLTFWVTFNYLSSIHERSYYNTTLNSYSLSNVSEFHFSRFFPKAQKVWNFNVF